MPAGPSSALKKSKGTKKLKLRTPRKPRKPRLAKGANPTVFFGGGSKPKAMKAGAAKAARATGGLTRKPVRTATGDALSGGQVAGVKAPVKTSSGGVRGAVEKAAKEAGLPGITPALDRLIQKESSWNPKAKNPTSTAHGLFQFLDSTRKNYGIQGRTEDPYVQAKAGLKYIKDRYGTVEAALAFHDKNNWY